MPDYKLELQARAEGYQRVCGIDEAGRGPLAGPVAAAAVILPENCVLPGLDDSKKLSEKKREALFPLIQQQALAYSVALVDNQTIDEINILEATMLAMRHAAEGLQLPPDYALIDGNCLPRGLSCPARTVVKGDALSVSIAAASVLAKVTRDRLMLEYDREFPQYQFARHKGYGTRLHTDLILQYGPCPLHRKSFLKKLLGENR